MAVFQPAMLPECKLPTFPRASIFSKPAEKAGGLAQIWKGAAELDSPLLVVGGWTNPVEKY